MQSDDLHDLQMQANLMQQQIRMNPMYQIQPDQSVQIIPPQGEYIEAVQAALELAQDLTREIGRQHRLYGEAVIEADHPTLEALREQIRTVARMDQALPDEQPLPEPEFILEDGQQVCTNPEVIMERYRRQRGSHDAD